MSLTLFGHHLSSYCQKATIAFYENDTPFSFHPVDLGNVASRAAHKARWPIGKMPVLRDQARGHTVVESTVVIEYLAEFYPGKSSLTPSDPDLRWQTRMHDRFFDLYVNDPLGKIVADKFRPEGRHDPEGVEQARALIETAYGMLEELVANRTWAVGADFTMADCAAAPALFFATQIVKPGPARKHIASYMSRLAERPSVARAAKEAEPFLHMFPKDLGSEIPGHHFVMPGG